MTQLGWAIAFLFSRVLFPREEYEHHPAVPLRRWIGILAAILAVQFFVAFIIQSFMEQDLSMFLIYFDTLAIPVGAIAMVLLVRPQPITKTRVFANVLPFVILAAIGMIVNTLWYLHLFITLVIGYVVAMVIYIIIYGHLHEAELRDQYSSLEGRSIRWIAVIPILLIFLIVNYLFYITSKNSFEPIIYYGLSFIIWNFVYVHIYRMVMEQEREKLTPTNDNDNDNDNGNHNGNDNHNDNDNDNHNDNDNGKQENAFLLKLRQVCEEQELYTHADLTRDELARQMGIGHTAFTMQLKQTTGLNFYDYINQLRIRKATELIEEGKMDISSISQQVGYRYRSTFYRAFAAVHGCTPTKYPVERN